MKKSILIIAGIGIFLSCNNTPETKEHKNHAEATEQKTHEAASHAAGTVSLNDGKKWVANPETTEGIKRMKMILDTLPAEASSIDWSGLKEKLETEFTTILQRCTMKGEAHDQLHNFLMPVEEMIRNLGKENPAGSQENVNALRNHLASYDLYFENGGLGD